MTDLHDSFAPHSFNYYCFFFFLLIYYFNFFPVNVAHVSSFVFFCVFELLSNYGIRKLFM